MNVEHLDRGEEQGKKERKHQPSGEGGTRSPPATPHRLQCRTACNASLPATPKLIL